MLGDRGVHDLITTGHWKTVLSADLASSTSLGTNFRAERVNFLNDQFLHSFDAILFFEAEIEFELADRFVGGVMPDLQVRVIQSLFAADTFGGVEAKHLGQEIGGKRVCIGEEGREGDARFDRERSNVILSTRRADATQCIFRRSAQIVKNLVELINVVSTLEDWLSTEKFGKNASNGPYINSCGIVAEA